MGQHRQDATATPRQPGAERSARPGAPSPDRQQPEPLSHTDQHAAAEPPAPAIPGQGPATGSPLPGHALPEPGHALPEQAPVTDPAAGVPAIPEPGHVTGVVIAGHAIPEQAHADSHGGLRAPMPGRILAVHVAPGAAVQRGAPLVVMEAMKMEHTVIAPRAGVVERVLCVVGEQVKEGVELLEFHAEDAGAS